MKTLLEQAFDIPFHEETGYLHFPWILIAPKGERQNLFGLKLTLYNNVRLEADFIPQRYAANLIRKMGEAPIDKKDNFCNNVKLLISRGAIVEIKINDVFFSGVEYSTWPSEWETFSFHFKKRIDSIVFSHGNVNEHSVMDKWGCLIMGTLLSLVDIVPISNGIDVESGYQEGRQYLVYLTKYERNPINRFLCLQHYGAKCQVCGLVFSEKYGDIGKNFIHVHHIIPVSKLGENYIIRPELDLVPVCPNCHAMLHRREPPYSIDELKERIKTQAVGM